MYVVEELSHREKILLGLWKKTEEAGRGCQPSIIFIRGGHFVAFSLYM